MPGGVAMSADLSAGLGFTAWLLLAASPVVTQPAPAGAAPQPNANVIAAWQQAGAEFGWLAHDRRFSFASLRFRREQPSRGAAVPAFRWARWKAGVLPGLPEPGVPYGLDLSFSRITDADLGELAGLGQLRSL